MYHQEVIKMNKLIENIILNKGKKKKRHGQAQNLQILKTEN